MSCTYAPGSSTELSATRRRSPTCDVSLPANPTIWVPVCVTARETTLPERTVSFEAGPLRGMDSVKAPPHGRSKNTGSRHLLRVTTRLVWEDLTVTHTVSPHSALASRALCINLYRGVLSNDRRQLLLPRKSKAIFPMIRRQDVARSCGLYPFTDQDVAAQ